VDTVYIRVCEDGTVHIITPVFWNNVCGSFFVFCWPLPFLAGFLLIEFDKSKILETLSAFFNLKNIMVLMVLLCIFLIQQLVTYQFQHPVCDSGYHNIVHLGSLDVDCSLCGVVVVFVTMFSARCCFQVTGLNRVQPLMYPDVCAVFLCPIHSNSGDTAALDSI